MIFLLISYLIIRFVFTQWLDSLGSYASYILEITVVTAAIAFSWQKFKNQWRLTRALLFFAVIALVCGVGIYKLAGLMQIHVPFDLSGSETLLFLLVIAPILEELIFRYFVWEPIAKFNKLTAFIGTTVLFSYSHFHSIWFVPEEIYKFIYYQTAYTLLLGAACGYSILKYKSLSGAIFIHFGFNLGFYIGSIV